MSEWILCSDKLPDHSDEVLVLIDGHRNPSWSNTYCKVGYYSHNVRRVWYSFVEYNDTRELDGVFAWQPLPAKIQYKEKKK
jgi:hypothetical protein